MLLSHQAQLPTTILFRLFTPFSIALFFKIEPVFLTAIQPFGRAKEPATQLKQSHVRVNASLRLKKGSLPDCDWLTSRHPCGSSVRPDPSAPCLGVHDCITSPILERPVLMTVLPGSTECRPTWIWMTLCRGFPAT